MVSHTNELSWSVRVVAAAALAVIALLLPRGALSDELTTTATAHSALTTSALPPGLPGTPDTAPSTDADAQDTAPSAQHATAVDAPLSMLARPTGPQVQPCRHLPPPQQLECLKITGGIDPRLMH